MFIIVANLGLLVAGLRLAAMAGYLLAIQKTVLISASSFPQRPTHPSELPDSLPYTHQLFPSVISFAY